MLQYRGFLLQVREYAPSLLTFKQATAAMAFVLPCLRTCVEREKVGQETADLSMDSLYITVDSSHALRVPLHPAAVSVSLLATVLLRIECSQCPGLSRPVVQQ
jgi:hypothetical protein